MGFGRVDFDAALELSAVLNANARRRNVADDRAVLFDVDAVARAFMWQGTSVSGASPDCARVTEYSETIYVVA